MAGPPSSTRRTLSSVDDEGDRQASNPRAMPRMSSVAVEIFLSCQTRHLDQISPFLTKKSLMDVNRKEIKRLAQLTNASMTMLVEATSSPSSAES